MLCHVLMLIILYSFVLTCCADCGVCERPAAYPFLCYCLHGRLVVLAPFLCIVPLSIVSEALHLPLHAQVKQSRAYWFLLDGGSTAVYWTLHVPKPMFEFAFEGELLPFIVNGDRFVLLALLPRRNPRTDRTVQPPY